MEEYLRLLPEYQKVDLEAVKFQGFIAGLLHA
jgi:lycopene cyclase CruP